MQRVALWVTYEGTNFSGYQVQPNSRTVQEEIERALSRIHKGEQIRIHSSGRTDTGVHARGQVVHFDSPLAIPADRWPKALNACLPDDIHILEATYVALDFHSRYHAVKKEYHYRVLLRKEGDVFRRNVTHHVSYPVSVKKMQEAAQALIGTFDFSSFCAANTSVVDKVRTLFALTIEQDRDELVFKLVGNGFLYNMVRIIVGTLLEIGAGKRASEELAAILLAKDRTKAGKTAPGNGLFLWKVSYETPIFSENY
ncbi:tRNA pseudouridine(38-40) synthase TruA [Alkalihalobacillus sp. MEB130]|uniref:tRNA pseudouridine(38-40) synthase TruA n=1 Tax=Alkalihalobacillus sp. MEB130 TaxID=2976704 RepID=UPI0028DDBFB0|nr:tRNA pseudouridine(38-40) synthase TruA [Alkalihalobacillus sp. MEB130]MDT8862258.1 tRNA pseudouridine(38-40) synthase TruA [Alkalihalobacillus sp. MEB130]